MVRKSVLALAFAAAALVPAALVETPPIPDPPTEGMEKAVADRILAARDALEENRSSAEAWGSLGKVFHAHYLESEAAPCYAEARRLAPGDFQWPYLLARLLKARDPARGLELLDDAKQSNPEYAPLYLLAAELQESLGDAEAAADSYREALSVDPASASAEFGLGRLALAKEALEESTRHLERASALAPDAGSIQALLSQAYRRGGREEDANRAAERAGRLHPDVEVRDPVLASVMDQAVSVAGFQMRAVEAERAGDPSRAEELLRRAMGAHPEDATLVYNLANHQSRQGRSSEAAETYRRALSLDSKHVAALVNLGILTAQSGEVDIAKRYFAQALENEPAHAGALIGLGNAAAAEGNLEEAISFFERALQSDSERPDAHFALGRLLAARGRVEQAIAHFTSALAAAPEKGEIHIHLAALYSLRGEHGAAERQIQLARTLGLNPPEELLRVLSQASK
jgi:tetratricopeptide (TPR) repeat protein